MLQAFKGIYLQDFKLLLERRFFRSCLKALQRLLNVLLLQKVAAGDILCIFLEFVILGGLVFKGWDQLLLSSRPRIHIRYASYISRTRAQLILRSVRALEEPEGRPGRPIKGSKNSQGRSPQLFHAAFSGFLLAFLLHASTMGLPSACSLQYILSPI